MDFNKILYEQNKISYLYVESKSIFSALYTFCTYFISYIWNQTYLFGNLYIPHLFHTKSKRTLSLFSISHIPYFKYGMKNAPFQYVPHSVPIPYFKYGMKNAPFQYVSHSVPIP